MQYLDHMAVAAIIVFFVIGIWWTCGKGAGPIEERTATFLLAFQVVALLGCAVLATRPYWLQDFTRSFGGRSLLALVLGGGIIAPPCQMIKVAAAESEGRRKWVLLTLWALFLDVLILGCLGIAVQIWYWF